MILVFAGAGASAAVDPKRYPTTLGFAEQLPRDIKQNASFANVLEFFSKVHNRTKPDIEDVLGALDDLQADCRKLTNSATLTEWVLRGHGHKGLPVGGVGDWSSFQVSLAELGANYIDPLSDRIKAQVYDLYTAEPEIEQLASWSLFLKGMLQMDLEIEIFTTNYDCVLEKAIDVAGVDIKTGRTFDNIRAELDIDPWLLATTHKKEELADMQGVLGNGLLTKLHGSVDWQRYRGRIKISDVFAGDHQKHCILYPGYKGEPTEDPFAVFHQHLRRVVNGVYAPLNAAVFIGFAFRDEAINRILEEIPEGTPTCFITKSDGHSDKQSPSDTPPPDAPRTGECIHFEGGFTERTARHCLGTLSSRISTTS